jgi:hypothetical protein
MISLIAITCLNDHKLLSEGFSADALHSEAEFGLVTAKGRNFQTLFPSIILKTFDQPENAYEGDRHPSIKHSIPR